MALDAAARPGQKDLGRVTTVQLLGSVDDRVSPEDNVDLVTGSDFVYLDVPSSGHASIIEMDDSPAGKGRRECFVHALIATSEELQAKKVMPSDDAPQSTNDKVTDVIFVIHGIRDEGFWTQKIARHVKFVGESTTRHFQTETSSYGYFAMLPFLLPSRRRAKVEWLMDQYTEALARYPKAEYSFVGHSNGTYMLARALRDYPACHFKRVVFAGSVVRCDYEWAKLLREKRVEAVLNYVATADWVVALFPKASAPPRLRPRQRRPRRFRRGQPRSRSGPPVRIRSRASRRRDSRATLGRHRSVHRLRHTAAETGGARERRGP